MGKAAFSVFFGWCLFVGMAVGAAASIARSPVPANVWVTDSLAKVHTDALPGTMRVAVLSAARNEWQSFQVHVRAGSSPIALNVAIGDLVNSATGERIPSATNLFVAREAYLDITHLSDRNGRLGWTPDPLVPAVDPYFHEARNAFPFTVPSNTTQSAWIDVLVPASVSSGIYTGVVTVLSGSTTLATIPVQLPVWKFTLPSTATLRSAFGLSWNGMCVQAYGSYYNCSRYPGSGGSNDVGVELTHVSAATFFLDHRLTLSQVVYYGPSNSDWSHFDSVYGALLNGTAGTLLPAAALSTMQYTASGLNAKSLKNWTAHFGAQGWLPRLFVYTCDEPPAGCTFAQARQRGDLVHTATNDALRTLLTTNISEATKHNLLQAIDILTPVLDAMQPMGGSSRRSAYDAYLKLPNKHLWWYQSCDQHQSCTNGQPGPKTSTWPSYMIDASPVRNRVFQWMAFLYKIEGELYYQSDYCWVATDCAAPDPWVSVYAFGGNGDGTLMYPGTPSRIGGTTPIPVSSIRLKLIQEGMQDFEYLTALANAGQSAFAIKTAQTFITNAYTFNNDPRALQKARATLGNRLNELGGGSARVR
jgi:glycosyl hydrolase family 123